ncbi:retinoblastoma-binding protein 5 homolog isoform X2 [Gordionus sp. m RMFG-2023]|uniref:retinoblastoma-binding protein 5 homolog isoform X2 n=1 Tax=Gordionus sp. m RMFG-2023 TaxID=3053472 RepID=UPI0031FBA4E4
MNTTLSTSVEKYPEAYDGCLDCVSYAITCTFNRRGTLLAVGCNDGRIIIWDFITRCIAKIIQAHTHPVCSLSWSRNGYKLLSAGTDNLVCIWDILSGECLNRFRFPALIAKVQFNPRNDSQVLVCLIKHPPVLLNLKSKRHITVPLDEETHQQDLNIVASFDRRGTHIYTGNARGKVLIFDSKAVKDSNPKNGKNSANADPISKRDPCPDDDDSEEKTLRLVACFKTSSGGITTSGNAIKAIEFAKRGENFLVCTADRVIRIYNADIALDCGTARQKGTAAPHHNNHKNDKTQNEHENRDNKDNNNNSKEAKENSGFLTNANSTVELEPIQKLCDLVNRTQWKSCCFSGGRSSLPELGENSSAAHNNGGNNHNNGASDSKNMHNSSSSRYVCAGSAKQHSIYIWELSTSNLVKILHGTKGEILLDLAWHPNRGVIASVSGGGAGSVALWSHPRIENWSAFAPDFRELDDNVEYLERESEFDLSDQDSVDTKADKERFKRKRQKVEIFKAKSIVGGTNGDLVKAVNSDQVENGFAEEESEDDDLENEERFVDVTTVEPLPIYLSSDEEELDVLKTNQEALLYLPTAPEIEDPEESVHMASNTSADHMDLSNNSTARDIKQSEIRSVDSKGDSAGDDSRKSSITTSIPPILGKRSPVILTSYRPPSNSAELRPIICRNYPTPFCSQRRRHPSNLNLPTLRHNERKPLYTQNDYLFYYLF